MVEAVRFSGNKGRAAAYYIQPGSGELYSMLAQAFQELLAFSKPPTSNH